jgi:hypothetical protein
MQEIQYKIAKNNITKVKVLLCKKHEKRRARLLLTSLGLIEMFNKTEFICEI